MDSIYTLLTYLIELTVFGSFCLFCFKMLEHKRNVEAKNYIQSLHAKVSMLRINLKSKIKKKSYKYRALFKGAVSNGDPIDLALVELIEIKLETGEELQRYFDLSKRINALLITENSKNSKRIEKGDNTDKPQIQEPQIEIGKEDFMGTDFKSELSIIRVIKDMVEISALVNRKIEAYNLSNQKASLPLANNLNFPSMTEVNRVFKKEKTIADDDTSEAA